MRHHRIALALCLSLLPAAPLAADEAWTSIGPEGGSVGALAFAPSRPATLYAGVDQRGIYRSTDGGQSWSPAGLRGAYFNDLAVDPVHPSTVYAATLIGLRKSTDGGSSWHRLKTGLHTLVFVVAVHPQNPSLVFASDADTLVRSTDGGLTWTASPRWPQRVISLSFVPSRPDTLYAGAENSVWKSTDAGRTWKRASKMPGLITALAVDPHSSRIVYAGGASGLILKSSDGGATWQRHRLPGIDLSPMTSIVLDPADPATVYATAGELFKSRNGGSVWARTGSGLEGPILATLEASPDGLLTGTSAGVFLSTDQAVSFEPRNRGLPALPVVDLAIDRQDPPRLYVSTPVNPFKTLDRGASWLPLRSFQDYDFRDDDPHRLQIDPLAPETIYVTTIEEVARSTDGGESWTVGGSLFCLFPRALYLDPRMPSALYVYGWSLTPFCGDICEFYRSVDAGRTWDCVPSSLFLVGVDPFTSAVYAQDGDRLWTSTDGGDTWTVLSGSLGKTYYFLTFSPLVQGTLWLPALGEVGRSRDSGRTWQFSSTGLPAVQIVALAPDPADAGTLYAGTEKDGVFESTDAGETWSPAGIWPAGVLLQRGLAVDPGDPSILYAGTDLAGVLMLDQGE